MFDGDLADPKLPLIPGHEIVGEVVKVADDVYSPGVGDLVGVPWLGYTCGDCDHCRADRENLCDNARFTGYDIDGGYAELVVADARFCVPLPPGMDPAMTAPFLCAGLIGYRSYKMAGDVGRLGLYGFGAAAHLIAQVAVHGGSSVYAFTKRGDKSGQEFALSLGAEWAGASDEQAPVPLDAAIIFAPAGELVPQALRSVRKGGTVVCAGIHMSDIPSFPYDILWGERVVRSVANLTRRDGEEFLEAAVEADVRSTIQRFSLEQANEALDVLRSGEMEGAGVLVVDDTATRSSETES